MDVAAERPTADEDELAFRHRGGGCRFGDERAGDVDEATREPQTPRLKNDDRGRGKPGYGGDRCDQRGGKMNPTGKGPTADEDERAPSDGGDNNRRDYRAGEMRFRDGTNHR